MLLTVEQFYELTAEQWITKLKQDFPAIMENVSVSSGEECRAAIYQIRKLQALTLHDITQYYTAKTADEICEEMDYNEKLTDYCDTISALNSIIEVLENLEF